MQLSSRPLAALVSVVLAGGLATACREVPLPQFPDPPATTTPTTTSPPTTTTATPTSATTPTSTTTSTTTTSTSSSATTTTRPPLTSIPTITDTTEPPVTTTEPPRKGVPVGSTVVFETDFADLGDFSNVQAEGINGDPDGYCGRVCVVDAGPGHETAARFELHPGDEAAGGERAELRVGDAGDTSPGDERWYEFDLQFEDFPPPEGENSGGHMIVMQWHTGSGSPLLTLNVDADGNFTIGERWDDPDVIGPIDEGVWHSYVVHVRFSQGDDGLVEVWRDGVKVAERRQATHKDDDNYLKLGIYRGGEDFVQSLLYDDLRITAP